MPDHITVPITEGMDRTMEANSLSADTTIIITTAGTISTDLVSAPAISGVALTASIAEPNGR
jgi:hypothetical protein